MTSDLSTSFATMCTSVIILIVIALIIITFFKLLKYAGYIGQYRAGTAMKKMSNQGLTINQGYNHLQHQPISQQHYNQPVIKSFCGSCGLQLETWQQYCPQCGRPNNKQKEQKF